jgi:hypothetical protein
MRVNREQAKKARKVNKGKTISLPFDLLINRE